jgi:hypothetical protein
VSARLSICAAFFAAALPAFAEESNDVFPLATGNSWIYRGETSWTEGDSSKAPVKIKTATLTWKMEVVAVAHGANVEAALIKGMPQDLSWYETGKSRGDYLIFCEDKTKFYSLDGEEALRAFSELQKTSALPVDIKEHAELFLDFPLTTGKGFAAESPGLEPGWHSWGVEADSAFNASEIKGAPRHKKFRAVSLHYGTAPDHQNVRFVPGLGIVGYEYGHHGTVAKTDLHLIEVSRKKSR